MKEMIYLINLYDIYNELLSERQKEYFKNYYFCNLSLGEISDNLGVSRNAVHKELKVIEEKLNNYEDKLKIYKKNTKLKEITISISDKKLKEKLEKISW